MCDQPFLPEAAAGHVETGHEAEISGTDKAGLFGDECEVVERPGRGSPPNRLPTTVEDVQTAAGISRRNKIAEWRERDGRDAVREVVLPELRQVGGQHPNLPRFAADSDGTAVVRDAGRGARRSRGPLGLHDAVAVQQGEMMIRVPDENARGFTRQGQAARRNRERLGPMWMHVFAWRFSGEPQDRGQRFIRS